MSKGRGVFKVIAATVGIVVLSAAVATFALTWMWRSVIDGAADMLSVEAPSPAGQSSAASNPFADLDFTAGPVDLIIRIGGDDYLQRDQKIVRQAAADGFPDYAGGEAKLMLLSVLFLSPPGNAPPTQGLRFQRDGVTLGEMHCMQAVCGKDAMLTPRLEALARAAAPLVEESAYYNDHAEYLAARQRLAAAPDRYGPLNPAEPQAKARFSDRLWLSFPLIYGDGLTEAEAMAHADKLAAAFHSEFAEDADSFEMRAPDVQRDTEFLFFSFCNDNAALTADDGTVLRPDRYEFYSIDTSIKASSDFAAKLLARKDWDFLPVGPADNARMTHAARRALSDAGLPALPYSCLILQNTNAGDRISLTHDVEREGYYLGWQRIVPREPQQEMSK